MRSPAPGRRSTPGWRHGLTLRLFAREVQHASPCHAREGGHPATTGVAQPTDCMAYWIAGQAGQCQGNTNLSPRESSVLHSASPRPSRGAVAKRRNERDGVRRPAGGLDAEVRTRAATGLPPGPLRGPARSWLTTCLLRYRPLACLSATKARLEPWGSLARCDGSKEPYPSESGARPIAKSPRLARREAPAAIPQGSRSHRFALFGAPPPRSRRAEGGHEQSPGAIRIAARVSLALSLRHARTCSGHPIGRTRLIKAARSRAAALDRQGRDGGTSWWRRRR